MVKYTSKYLEGIRQFIYNNNGKVIGNTYKKKYRNEKVNHVTIEYVENGRIKYKPLPEFAVNKAHEKQRVKQWEPVIERQAVMYRGKHPTQKKYHGKFTFDQIKEFGQKMSNENARQGKKGLFEIAIKNWDGLGQWRTSKLRPYGAPIEWLSNYDGSQLPEEIDQFAIYEL